MLPTACDTPMVVHCKSGKRANEAISYLAAQGYTRLLNAGGPAQSAGEAEGWAALKACLPPDGLVSSHAAFDTFIQLFDGPAEQGGGGSSTYTYILGDATTGEALIIDPVLEQVDRDLAVAADAGLTLTLAFNTHCHADHITGTHVMKGLQPSLRSVISTTSGAAADIHLAPGESVTWANGARSLQMRPTPGHTGGCTSYYDATMDAVFTGDALLINGCGRTDFQEGDAATLYDSVHSQIFSLPRETIVFPGHDYNGRLRSSVGSELKSNARLGGGRTKEEFVELMANLKLQPPKKLAISLPANLRDGAPARMAA